MTALMRITELSLEWSSGIVSYDAELLNSKLERVVKIKFVSKFALSKNEIEWIRTKIRTGRLIS